MLCNYDEMNLDAYNELLTVGSEAMETITSNDEKTCEGEKEMFNRDTLIINIPDYPVAIYNILTRNNITKLGQVIDLINSGELINLHRMGKKRAEDTIKITNLLPIEDFEPECVEEVVTTPKEVPMKHLEEINIKDIDITDPETVKDVFMIKRISPVECGILCLKKEPLELIMKDAKDPTVIFVRIPCNWKDV